MSADKDSSHAIEWLISPTDLLKDIIALSSEQWVSPARFIHLVENYEIRDITLKVIFTKQVIDILRDVPLPVFGSPEIRNNIIEAARSALESFILEEEGCLER